MSSKKEKIKDTINKINIYDIVNEEISRTIDQEIFPNLLTKLESVEEEKTQINEATYLTSKKFKQVSDYVSETTKQAHEKLYMNYVEAFNNVSNYLDTIPKGNSNSFSSAFRSAKLDEVKNLNAAFLHELYFSNCFDPNSQIHMDSKSFMRINRDFGSFDVWQKDFIATALSAGEGWVVLGYNMFLNKYVNAIIQGHDENVMLGLYPILVLDVWSHAYYRDFDIDKKSYIVAMMRSINWEIVESRIEKTEKIYQFIRD